MVGRPCSAALFAILVSALFVVMLFGPAAAGLQGPGATSMPFPAAFEEAPVSDEIWLGPGLDAWDGPKRLVIGVDDGAAPSIVMEWTAAGIPSMAFTHVPVIVALVMPDAFQRILSTQGVLSVVTDEVVETFTALASVETNFAGTGDEMLRADLARALGFDGSGVGVAVIDSGLSSLHPGLLPELLGGPTAQNVHVVVSEHPVVPGTPGLPVRLYLEDQPTTDLVTGHGSHVAGIAAGSWTDDGAIGGRAPGARLIGLGAGEGTLVISWIIAAFDWLIENQERYNIRVVNNSYGNVGPFIPAHPVNLATRAADENGILVVFAAGNSGPTDGTMSGYARAPYVLAVGATTLSGHVPDFSSRGGPGSEKPGPDVVAPGVNVIGPRAPPVSVADSGRHTLVYDAALMGEVHALSYRALSGTSMAAPQAAGVAALLFEAGPGLTPAEVRDLLRETARPIIGASPSAQGAGLIDAEAALLRLIDGQAGPQDWVLPQEVLLVDEGFVHPFVGGFVGAPAKNHANRHELDFPVRSPALGVEVSVRWDAVGPIAAGAAVTGLELLVLAPDGALVERVAVTGGSAGVLIPPEVLEVHAPSGWSAGYWTAVLTAETGALTYTLEATVLYEDGVLPPVAFDLEPIPPGDPPTLVERGAIVIPDDAAFVPENGIVAGSGTSEDPYIISGWQIGETARSIHIGSITGTTAHVIVRDLHLHDAQYCVYLENAHNVVIEDSLMATCGTGVYGIAGTSSLIIQGNEFVNNVDGIALYGVIGAQVVHNEIVNSTRTGLILSQGLTLRAAASIDLAVIGNTFIGPTSYVNIFTPVVAGAEIQGNTFGRGAHLIFNLGTWGHVVSDTTWLTGRPDIRDRLLTVQLPTSLPVNTVIDAGLDLDMDASGRVCVDRARADVAPPWTLTGLYWEMGDGTTIADELRPCHIYSDASAHHEPHLVVLVEDAFGETRVLTDTLRVAPAG